MIIITNIQTKPSYSLVEFSNENTVKMHFDMIFKYALSIEQEFEEEKYLELINENEQIMGFNQAVNYIQTALKTKKQVKDYLLKRNYHEKNIDEIIIKLKSYNFLNDKEYACAYVRTYKNKYGKFKISDNLYRRGVSKEIIAHALEQIDNSFEVIYNMANKYMKNKELTQNNINKLYRFLLGRGFSYEETSYAVDEFKKHLAELE